MIRDDQFVQRTMSLGSGGNGFYGNPCTKSFQPFSPAEAPMGLNNTFANVCYLNNDVGLPPNPCK